MEIEEQREDTRARILRTAAPVIAAEGFAGASTRALAHAAGVNVATLAYHFGDKQGLYLALVDHTYERMLDLDVGDLDGDTPAERLRVLIHRLYAFARENRVYVRVLLRHVLENRRLPEAVAQKWIGPILARAGEALAQLGVPLDSERLLALLSLNHLIVRYAITEADDLALFGTDGDPHAKVADHLAEVACRLLGLG